MSKIKDAIVKLYEEHVDKTYPYTEEDDEGVITWESSRRCKMLFKELSVKDGYNKTVKAYKKGHLLKRVSINIEGNYVVVQF